jgi:hypothetical protein
VARTVSAPRWKSEQSLVFAWRPRFGVPDEPSFDESCLRNLSGMCAQIRDGS